MQENDDDGGVGPTPPIPPVNPPSGTGGGNGNGGGTCTKCHSNNPPSAPQNPYSDWYSGTYSGCFMCHAAQSYNQTSLTNSQLAAYNETLYNYGGYYGMAALGGAAIGTGIGLSFSATLTSGGACASNSQCLTSVDDMFEGASNIADDAYVAIHPAVANASIIKNGLDPAKAGSEYVYLTQMKYIRGVDLVSAADNLVVDAGKWTSQPITLWEVSNTAQNLQPYLGPGLGNVPQWVSSSPLVQTI